MLLVVGKTKIKGLIFYYDKAPLNHLDNVKRLYNSGK